MGSFKKNRMRIAVAGVALVAAGAVFAALSPLLISVSTDGAGLLSVSTNSMPKGWFSSRNAFDRSKSNVVTAYTLGATDCSAAKSGGSLNSTTDGSFTPEDNGQGTTIGYFYNVSKDLSASQNRWYNHQHCNGTVEVHGCASAIPVTVTATAYDRNGACHTYTDDSGVTRCASDTQVAALGAVQDPDVVDTACGEVSCGIGACVSACEQEVNSTCSHLTGQARQACMNDTAHTSAKAACPCNCKQQLPASCPEHNECPAD